MKYIILIFVLIFVTCCKSNNDIESNDSFFETYSFKLNKDILPDSISFEEDYLDYHFPELGTIKKTKNFLECEIRHGFTLCSSIKRSLEF